MICMYCGETRRIGLLISDKNNTPFEVTNATYELQRVSNNAFLCETSGACVIDGHTLYCMISPPCSGIYTLKYEMTIGTERIIKKLDISVQK